MLNKNTITEIIEQMDGYNDAQEFTAEAGWQDWMAEILEDAGQPTTDGDELTDTQTRIINETIEDIWYNHRPNYKVCEVFYEDGTGRGVGTYPKLKSSSPIVRTHVKEADALADWDATRESLIKGYERCDYDCGVILYERSGRGWTEVEEFNAYHYIEDHQILSRHDLERSASQLADAYPDEYPQSIMDNYAWFISDLADEIERRQFNDCDYNLDEDTDIWEWISDYVEEAKDGN